MKITHICKYPIYGTCCVKLVIYMITTKNLFIFKILSYEILGNLEANELFLIN